MLATAATAAVGLGASSVAHAGFHTFGSDLEANTDWAETHGADAFFFQTKFADGRDPTSTATGQIVQIRLKGMAVPSGQGPPLTEIHFQTMAIRPDGSPWPQISSGPVLIPAGGDPNQITTYDMRAQNFCIGRGVHIVFTDEGGFDPAHGYPNGVPYQVFGHVRGAATRQLVVTAGGGEDNVVEGQELLMQVVVATGPDATALCPDGTATDGGHLPGPESGARVGFTGALMLNRTARVDGTRRHVRVALRCSGARPCKGRVKLAVTRRVGARERRVALAAGGFRLRVGQTRTLSLKLTRAARRILRTSSRVRGVSATAITYTSAGPRRSSVQLTVRR